MGADPRGAAPRRPSPVALAAALVAAVVAAVVLAGPVQGAIEGLGARPDFRRVFRYVALALVLAAVALVLRPWRDVPRDLWGLRGDRPSRTARLVLAGAAVALGLLVALALLHAAADLVRWDRGDGVAKARSRALRFGLAALPFAALEEAFFRGWLLDRLGFRRRAFAAAVAGSFLFALPHAFRASDAGPPQAPGADGAVAILRAWARSLADVADFGPSFAGLFLFALALAGARRRFGTLAAGVGAHAAVYAGLPVYSALTDPTSPGRSWLGGKFLYDGVPGVVLLAALAALAWPRAAGGPGAPASPPPR